MSFDQHDEHSASPRPRRRWLLALPVAVVVVGLVWLAVEVFTPDTFTVEGTLKLRTNCDGDGAQVEIVDRESRPLAVSKLKASANDRCELSFTVSDVPGGEPLYGVRVGDGRLGVVWHSEDEMRGGVSLTASP